MAVSDFLKKKTRRLPMMAKPGERFDTKFHLLAEMSVALRNPAILDPVLSAAEAVEECQIFRRHPHWQLDENAEVMSSVWEQAPKVNFSRRRIFDLRLAKTLLAQGVTRFATPNTKDFSGIGFKEVWNPLKSSAERKN